MGLGQKPLQDEGEERDEDQRMHGHAAQGGGCPGEGKNASHG
jgi:hypothetical protein